MSSPVHVSRRVTGQRWPGMARPIQSEELRQDEKKGRKELREKRYSGMNVCMRVCVCM